MYDDLLVRRLIEKITIHGRLLTIEIKLAIEIENDIKNTWRFPSNTYQYLHKTY